jgi:hypothetical protein
MPDATCQTGAIVTKAPGPSLDRGLARRAKGLARLEEPVGGREESVGVGYFQQGFNEHCALWLPSLRAFNGSLAKAPQPAKFPPS